MRNLKNNIRFLLLISSAFLIIGCQAKEEAVTIEPEKKEKTEFQMYEVSEMTALMELFFADNKLIKRKIEEGNFDFGSFPENYNTIFSAELTDPTDRDDFLEDHSHQFLEAQKLVYSSTGDPKDNFNSMVDACIQCHQKKCSGPIERIEKLYIK